jgi:hypothetical protein
MSTGIEKGRGIDIEAKIDGMMLKDESGMAEIVDRSFVSLGHLQYSSLVAIFDYGPWYILGTRY